MTKPVYHLARLLLVLATVSGAEHDNEGCGTTSDFIGTHLPLQGAPGNLTVLDDCTFEVLLLRHADILEFPCTIRRTPINQCVLLNKHLGVVVRERWRGAFGGPCVLLGIALIWDAPEPQCCAQGWKSRSGTTQVVRCLADGSWYEVQRRPGPCLLGAVCQSAAWVANNPGPARTFRRSLGGFCSFSSSGQALSCQYNMGSVLRTRCRLRIACWSCTGWIGRTCSTSFTATGGRAQQQETTVQQSGTALLQPHMHLMHGSRQDAADNVPVP